jgi:transcriptional regulator with XRE-family HTH domain
MTRPIGPTIPRWQLGEQLAALRERAAVSQAVIAQHLGCSVSKIQKIEAGDVGVVRAELMLMLDVYGVRDSAVREELAELQRLGKQRGWWWRFGQLPVPFATFLGLESAATALRIFEPLVVHGLLQTEAYARAVAETWDGAPLPADEVDRQLRIKRERQRRVFGPDPPEMWVIFDEAALRRQVGGPDVMAAQLAHLAEMAERITVQVVPFGAGGYAGLRGALTLFEFDERMHSPVAYVEGHAGNLYLEKDIDLRRCNVVFRHISAAALGRAESVRMIRGIADGYSRGGSAP